MLSLIINSFIDIIINIIKLSFYGFITGSIIFLAKLSLKRREISKLGVAILNMIINEVKIGIDLIKNKSQNPLPVKSWYGPQTIPNDVLIRIMYVSKGCKLDKADKFMPRNILEHCKDYFEYLVPNWEGAIKVEGNELDKKQEYYLERAVSVEKLLSKCKDLLEENSKIILFPK